MQRFLAAVLFLLVLPAVAASVEAGQFGIRPDGSPVPRAAVARAAGYLREHPGTTLVFPAGDYRFTAAEAARKDLFLSNSDATNPRSVALLFEDLRGARLEGRGARLLFRGAILPIALLRCRDVAVVGFEVDWTRARYSQAEVVAADPSGLTLKLDPVAYPYRVDRGRLLFLDGAAQAEADDLMEFDPGTGGVASGTGDAGCLGQDWEGFTASEPAPGLVRLARAFRRLPKVGHVLVFRHSPRDHAGAFLEDCRDLLLQDLTYRHTSGLGILAQYTENLTCRNVQFRPREGSGRLFSGHDDGIHVSNCKGAVVIEDCGFEGLLDDPINVHGTAVKVVGRGQGGSLLCRFMHEQSVGLKFGDPGDEVSFLDHRTLLSRGTGRIKALRRSSATDFEVQLEAPAPALAEGDALENLTWTPEVAIRGCRFGPVRARGLLLTTPRRTVVEDCVFRSSGTAILVAGDANEWYETGAVRDVLIRHNRFENCLTSTYEFCNAVICVDPQVHEPGPRAFHHGLRIEDNVFVTFDRPLLWALSVDGLTFTGNTVVASRDYAPWHANRFGLTFLHCANVTVAGNRLDPAFQGREVRIEGGAPATIRIADWAAQPQSAAP